MDPGDYARASALVVHATLIKTIEANYPTLTMADQDQILIDIIGRVAAMRGWEIRRLCFEEVDGE
jgi:hypothetical protein